MEELLKERDKLLDELLEVLFSMEEQPYEQLISAIAVQKALTAAPHKINKPSRIRADTSWIYEKYGAGMEILNEEKTKEIRCPISKGLIEEEWHGVCGHVFDKQTVEEYIKKTDKCPVFGCNKRLKPNKKVK